MSVKVKKKVDRRPELMRSLETAAGKALQHAATLCKGVARQLVSKRYQMTKEERDRKNAKQRKRRAEERERLEAMKPQQQAPSAAANAARSRERRAEMQRRRRQRARDAMENTQD